MRLTRLGSRIVTMNMIAALLAVGIVAANPSWTAVMLLLIIIINTASSFVQQRSIYYLGGA